MKGMKSMKSMSSIKELEQRIDFILLERYATIAELGKILENSADSNETKLEKSISYNC
jgi:hypothetical protein